MIQPNYRGSSGYGKDFLGENAFHEWRRVMSDIRDSADWLQKQGLADPKRIAIVGWSYGGYAALQSAAMDPRYKAVVAIAPVTGLKQLGHENQGFISAALIKDEIGKGDQLDEGSPINHAGDIHAPCFWFTARSTGTSHTARASGCLELCCTLAIRLTCLPTPGSITSLQTRRPARKC